LSGNVISAAAGQSGLQVDAGQRATSTGDTYSPAATGVAITNNGTSVAPAALTLTTATVTGAGGTGLLNAGVGTATITGSTFTGLDVAINATAGVVNLSTSTIDACGNAGTVAPNPRGAIQLAGGIVYATANTITNGPGAIARQTAAGSVGSQFKFNTLTGNVGAFVNTALIGGAGVLDCTNNWWGSAAGPTVASSAVVGGIGVLTNPWLIAQISNVTVNAGAASIGASAATSQAVSGVAVVMTTAGALSANMNVIATGNYTGNPVTVEPPADTVKSFDVYIQGPAANVLLDTATITFFGITNPLAQVYAYSQTQNTYVLCSDQRVDMFQGAVIVTVHGVNSVNWLGGPNPVTSPNLGNMSGLEFVLTEPSVAPLGAPAQASLSPAQAATGISTTLASFSWDAVAGADSYNFQLAPYFDVVDPFQAAFIMFDTTVPTNGIILVNEDLDYYETYAWRVQAVRGTEEGAWVTSFFITEAEPVEPPDPIEIVIPEPTPTPEIEVIVPAPTEVQVIPEYLLWVIVGVAAVLVIAVIVLIVRTRRVA
jgi:hypothetical protein